jgi:putative endonuclease
VSDSRKSTGARGERVAAEYLRRKQYTILDTNWRCRRGEIDLVAQDEATLVFVEVRTRSSARLGSPEESVTATKQRRLAELAETYLLSAEQAGKPWHGPWRIDVIAIRLRPHDGDTRAEINHLLNAVEGVGW